MPVSRKRYEYAASRNQPLAAEAYATPGTAVFLTVRAYRGRPFESNPALCEATIGLLAEMREAYGCWVGAYCLMPDHLHFIAGPEVDGRSVLTFVARLKGRTTNTSWQHGNTGRLWQPRCHDHILRKEESLADTYAYILDNPVRAGLVATPEQWPWSGILDPPK